MSDTNLLFVIGVWRSGTSLLQALLNRHPKIALMYEAEPINLWPNNSSLLATRHWPRRLEFCNQTFSRHGIPEESVAAHRAGREGALALYRQFAERRGAVIMGEKAPAYYCRLTKLAGLFPGARFLIIWRDPLACCRSALVAGRTNRFFASSGMMTRMLFGWEKLARGVEMLRKRGSLLHEVVYDELVANPEKELRAICKFLEIEFAPEMVDLKSADVSNVPAGEHHAGVRSGVIGAGNRPDALPCEFSAKGRRYAKLWHQRFSGLAFARALKTGDTDQAPGMTERLRDRGAFLYWRAVEESKRLIFRVIPLSLWAKARKATPRATQGETAPKVAG